jgi:hypothetical protein
VSLGMVSLGVVSLRVVTLRVVSLRVVSLSVVSLRVVALSVMRVVSLSVVSLRVVTLSVMSLRGVSLRVAAHLQDPALKRRGQICVHEAHLERIRLDSCGWKNCEVEMHDPCPSYTAAIMNSPVLALQRRVLYG